LGARPAAAKTWDAARPTSVSWTPDKMTGIARAHFGWPG